MIPHDVRRTTQWMIRFRFNESPNEKCLRAINLIDLVTKTRGADHLKLESRHLNLLQFLCLDVVAWDKLYKNWSSGKIDSRRLFPREYDFPKTFSLTENQFSGKTFFYTIASSLLLGLFICGRIAGGLLLYAIRRIRDRSVLGLFLGFSGYSIGKNLLDRFH